MFTQAGRVLLLDAALRNQSLQLYIGLCQGEYAEDLNVADIVEPTIGTNGYARQLIPMDAVGWAVDGIVNNEIYFETDWFTWAAVGGDFNAAIQRVFLVTDSTATDVDVVALGGAFPAEILITPTTDEADRKFKFRIYAR